MDEIDDANLGILGNGSCEAIGVVAVVKTLEIKGRNETMKLAIQAGRKANPGEGNRDL